VAIPTTTTQPPAHIAQRSVKRCRDSCPPPMLPVADRYTRAATPLPRQWEKIKGVRKMEMKWKTIPGVIRCCAQRAEKDKAAPPWQYTHSTTRLPRRYTAKTPCSVIHTSGCCRAQADLPSPDNTYTGEYTWSLAWHAHTPAGVIPVERSTPKQPPPKKIRGNHDRRDSSRAHCALQRKMPARSAQLSMAAQCALMPVVLFCSRWRGDDITGA